MSDARRLADILDLDVDSEFPEQLIHYCAITTDDSITVAQRASELDLLSQNAG